LYYRKFAETVVVRIKKSEAFASIKGMANISCWFAKLQQVEVHERKRPKVRAQRGLVETFIAAAG
jgi:hypothetical protein